MPAHSCWKLLLCYFYWKNVFFPFPFFCNVMKRAVMIDPVCTYVHAHVRIRVARVCTLIFRVKKGKNKFPAKNQWKISGKTKALPLKSKHRAAVVFWNEEKPFPSLSFALIKILFPVSKTLYWKNFLFFPFVLDNVRHRMRSVNKRVIRNKPSVKLLPFLYKKRVNIRLRTIPCIRKYNQRSLVQLSIFSYI